MTQLDPIATLIDSVNSFKNRLDKHCHWEMQEHLVYDNYNLQGIRPVATGGGLIPPPLEKI